MGLSTMRVTTVLLAALSFNGLAWAQTEDRIAETFERMPPEQLNALRIKLQSQMDGLQRTVRVQRDALDTVLSSQDSTPDIKTRVISVRESNLRQTQRTLAVFETAKVMSTGAQVSDQLRVLFPDVHESIMRLSNPMLPLCGSSVSYRGDGASISWQKLVDQFLKQHGQLLPAVGKIEIEVERYRQGPSQPEKYTVREVVGTGFAVSPNRVVTAGHVAAMFHDPKTNSWRDGVLSVSFFTGGEHPHNCASPDQAAIRVKLAKVVAVKYSPGASMQQAPHDYAVLEAGSDEPRLPRALSLASEAAKPSTYVFVVSYPDADHRVDKQIWSTMMNVPIAGGGMFPVIRIKRLAPGTVQPPCANGTDFHMPHDATTLNRSSGGPIIDAQSGKVVAIQVSGFRELREGEEQCNLGLRSSAIPTTSTQP